MVIARKMPESCKKCPHISVCLVRAEVARYSYFSLLKRKRLLCCPLHFSQSLNGYVIDGEYEKKAAEQIKRCGLWKSFDPDAAAAEELK